MTLTESIIAEVLARYPWVTREELFKSRKRRVLLARNEVAARLADDSATTGQIGEVIGREDGFTIRRAIALGRRRFAVKPSGDL